MFKNALLSILLREFGHKSSIFFYDQKQIKLKRIFDSWLIKGLLEIEYFKSQESIIKIKSFCTYSDFGSESNSTS